MPVQYDLILDKPVSVLNSPVDINLKTFFTHLGKALVAGSFGDFKGAAEYGLDALGEVGLQDKPEQAAWLLVSRSLLQAVETQVDDYKDLLREKLDDAALADLAERVEHTLNAVTVSIDASFFDNPRNLPLLEDFKSALVVWLQELGMNAFEADAFHNRLRGQFVLAIHDELKAYPDKYDCILQQVDTRVTGSVLEERAWQYYNDWLQEQANARVFEEAFGLRQVYIRLRAYYLDKLECDSDHKPAKKIVCDLHSEIEKWVMQFNKDDALRVISGGPGCGKSSFAKVLAGDLAQQKAVPVLFVPLHHFNHQADLIQAVGAFVQNDPYLRGNPLDPKDGQKRLLMIFDGLDELSMQGKSVAETAQEFVDEVIRVLNQFNGRGYGIKWQALITGRDLAVQANESRLRKSKHVFHTLPYFVSVEDSRNYNDSGELLNTDQRDAWWQQFGKVKGKDYQGMPSELSMENLQPITREPLLNYLIALSYERSELEFNENTSLNAIYEDLLKAVHERAYEDHQHSASTGLALDDFMQVLEEVALAVWHGNGRTASTRYLLERCEAANVAHHLELYTQDTKQGVVRLLTAFYFREAEKDIEGDSTFEFTHKSFGEYLTARRIVEGVSLISDEMERYKEKRRGGLTPENALIDWVKVCGATAIDDYLAPFIKDEVVIRFSKGELVTQWQRNFLDLLSYVLRENSPMEKTGLSTFAEMLRQSRNSEEALLVVHHMCASQTKQVLDVDWGESTAFGTWVKRIHSQLSGADDLQVLRSMAYLKLKHQALRNINFSGANLLEADLSEVDFFEANLSDANLAGANLVGADLSECNLSEAYLEGADLSKSNLSEAYLVGADLTYACLKYANVVNANLAESHVFSADLSYANFSHATFSNAYLYCSKFLGGNLSNANLAGADLAGSSFTYASLSYANLSVVNLSEADLVKANISYANLSEASLADANLFEADLFRANLSEADLTGSTLDGVDFFEANLTGTFLEYENIELITRAEAKVREFASKLRLLRNTLLIENK